MNQATNILMVGGSEEERLACSQALALHESDWQLDFCNTAYDALVRIEDAAPHCILLHSDLPNDGSATLLHALLVQRHGTVPILLLVMPEQEALMLDALAIGLKDYLLKDSGYRYVQLLAPLMGKLLRVASERRVTQELIQESESRFSEIFDHSPSGMALVSLDGQWLEVNLALCNIVGYTESELLEIEFKDITYPDDFLVDQTFVQLALADQIKTYQMETRYFHKDGHIVPVMLNASLVRHLDGTPRYFILRIEDVTQRKKMEDALFAEKDFAQTTLQSIGDAVITTDAQAHIIHLNPIAEQLTGWSNKDAAGLPLAQVFVIMNEATREVVVDPVRRVLEEGLPHSFDDNVVLVSRNGTEYSIDSSTAPIRVQDGTLHGIVLVFHDVTETRAQHQKISYRASHDALTGLCNRSEFEAMTARLLYSAKNLHLQHTLLFLDLDQFKIVNDTCGHLAGDQLLCQISNLLLSNTRKSDMLARLGGDEFGILLDCCPQERALEIAQNLVDKVRAYRFEWEDKLFSVGVSIGLVAITERTADLQALLKDADSACYGAKQGGRNRVEIFAAQPGAAENNGPAQHATGDWAARLQLALEQNQFVLYSQNIVPILGNEAGNEAGNADGGAAVPHAEILLRYRDAQGGLLLPLSFIPAAERYGLLPAIDRWVIKRVLRQPPRLLLDAAKMTRAPFVSINISSASLNEAGFKEFVVRELQASSLSARQICFEITETAAITNLHRVIEFMYALKTMGCQFSLDDFGSGLSSFGYLKSLPVDYLKIDGSLVQGIALDKVNYAMVESIHRIAQAMDIKTVAKFVENDDVLNRLRDMGVHYAQGFGLHAPELLSLSEPAAYQVL